ncbi:hypothetical protein CCP3SC1AL1_240028 [Gammaproteobacteria bacterium]
MIFFHGYLFILLLKKFIKIRQDIDVKIFKIGICGYIDFFMALFSALK